MHFLLRFPSQILINNLFKDFLIYRQILIKLFDLAFKLYELQRSLEQFLLQEEQKKRFLIFVGLTIAYDES